MNSVLENFLSKKLIISSPARPGYSLQVFYEGAGFTVNPDPYKPGFFVVSVLYSGPVYSLLFYVLRAFFPCMVYLYYNSSKTLYKLKQPGYKAFYNIVP